MIRKPGGFTQTEFNYSARSGYLKFEVWIGSIGIDGSVSVVALRRDASPKISLRETFFRGFGNWGRLIGTRILIGIYVVLPLLFLILPVIFVGAPLFRIIWGSVPGCAFLYFFVRISFAENQAVINEEGGSPAISESWKVTKGRFRQIIGYEIVISAPLLLVIFVFSVIYLIPFADNSRSECYPLPRHQRALQPWLCDLHRSRHSSLELSQREIQFSDPFPGLRRA